jgi:hypothetical protein
MSIASLPLASGPIAAAAESVSSSGGGALAPFTGFGVQGSFVFRGERFWATETQTRWRARESDSQQMLGTTDKAPLEKVRYEMDFLDILNGSSITSFSISVTGSLVPLSSETVSNGEQVHLVRTLVSGGSVGVTDLLSFRVQCADGALRVRSIKVRGREL